MTTMRPPVPVPERAALAALTTRSDQKGLTQLAGHLGLLVVTATLVMLARGSLWTLVPAMLVHGVVLVFLFAPLHETIHRTAFRRRWLNDLVAWPCGLVLILPPTYFRCFHFAHHRHTQNPARDPELASPKPASLGGYLLQASGLPYWRERVATTLGHAWGRVEEPFVAPRQRASVRREARWFVAVYAALAASAALGAGEALTILWVLPALLGQPVLRLYLMAEHGGCPLVPAMLANSRTTLTTAWLRRLAWNMPYHAEHHAHPALPFHALPAAHGLLRAQLGMLARGYLAVHRELVGGLGKTGRGGTPGRGGAPGREPAR